MPQHPTHLAVAMVTPAGSIRWLSMVPVPLRDALWATEDFLDGEDGAFPPGTMATEWTCVPGTSLTAWADMAPADRRR